MSRRRYLRIPEIGGYDLQLTDWECNKNTYNKNVYSYFINGLIFKCPDAIVLMLYMNMDFLH